MDTFIERYTPSLQTDHLPQRSKPGRGEQVKICVLGPAATHHDCMVPRFGDTAGCGPNIGEDFAVCGWPVVVKVKIDVSDASLVTMLRDLADSIERHSAAEVDQQHGDITQSDYHM